MSRSTIPAELRRLVRERAGLLCEYCRIHEHDTYFGCELDHIISEKHGGATSTENMALACVDCNRRKGSDIGTIADDGSFVRLFNPRIDHWDDHFLLQGASIQPRTAIGMATIRLLRFNESARLIQRAALVSAKRFPADVDRSP